MLSILKFRRAIVAALISSTMLMSLPNCFGSFVLTGKWHGFIKGINNKWLRWIVFVITSIVYGIAIFVDVILFNSIEFWSGSNPMARSDFNDSGELVKSMEAEGERVQFTYRNYGETLRVDMWKDEQYRGNMVLLKSEPGVFYREDSQGALHRIEVAEQELKGLKTVRVEAGRELQASRQLGVMEYYALRDEAERLNPKSAEQFELERAIAAQPAAAGAL